MENINLLKKTKIVCTIGPASENISVLKKLIDNGMNIMRLNFSHGSYDSHYSKLLKARALEKDNIYIPVMLDTKGPEVRTHDMENGKIEIKKGQITRISMKEVLGTPEKISVNFSKLYDDVNEGNHIKIDDGKLDLEVIEKDKSK
ncbi:MAG: pyruvate kinase, partial [Bacilli bacterium]|nr:pyruvate kinase [Bacilli bacterium]